MGETLRAFRKIVFIIYLIFVHGVLLFLLAEKFLPQFGWFSSNSAANVPDPTEQHEVPTPLPVPSLLSDLSNSETNNSAETLRPPVENQQTVGLIVPVAGVRREQLIDTFTDARSEGRTHDAIDIPAPAGTPVLAAGDGKIVKFWDSEKGGITIYQLSADQKFFYYYAHLQRRADGIKEGDFISQGTTIGFVGDTGNAGPGNYHLHFGISIVIDPRHYWGGTDVNPYPLLRYPHG